jgi:DNA-binding NtrC family response regulator
MKKTVSLLVVDDEKVVRDSLTKWFREDGYEVESAESGAEALKKMQDRKWDILLLDIKMPGMDGMELHDRVREIDPTATVIFITAHATVDTAVKALKNGAYDYVTKPVDPDYLSHMVTNVIKQRNLADENVKLKEKISEVIKTDLIIGESQSIKKVFEHIDSVAKTDTTVMIRGESGTGKELIARAIHHKSGRKFFPIVTLNCGGLPEGVLESELFGHERGAFTGAHYRRKGKIELADGGTLFLDEIGNIDRKTQLDLLRVIETKQFTRVGGNEVIKVDFRIISATNRNLEEAVKEGVFREDLFYRLNVFTIDVPPLRERNNDVLLLSEFFLNKYAQAIGKPFVDFAPDALEKIKCYSWPGNVRELENAIERAVVVGTPPHIRAYDLPFLTQEKSINNTVSSGSLEAVERDHIIRVLEQQSWNISRSAETLKIDRATLYNKIQKYGLKKPS